MVDMEEKDVDIVAQKHLLMLMHAPMQFKVDEIISSMSLGFDEFEQEFEVVCALSFSPPNSLPNRGDKEFSYFKQFGKGQFDCNRHNDCSCLKTFVMALVQLFLNQSVKEFTFVDDGQLVAVPDKSTTKSDNWNSLKVSLFLIVLLMMLYPSQARTLSTICHVFLEHHPMFTSVALMSQKGMYVQVYMRFCMKGQNNDDIPMFGKTPYHLHLHHLSELNVLGVNPCLPNRKKFNSCLHCKRKTPVSFWYTLKM